MHDGQLQLTAFSETAKQRFGSARVTTLASVLALMILAGCASNEGARAPVVDLSKNP